MSIGARRAAPLTRERIAAAAVTLLDDHDGPGLTMRRLAGALDVTPTALYWHVDTRDGVLDLALDHIFGDVPVPPSTDDWRDDLTTLVGGWRAAMLRHPWAPELIGRSEQGPNVRERTAFLRSALARGGHDGRRLDVTTHLVANYVIGSALTQTDAGLFTEGLSEILQIGTGLSAPSGPGPGS